MAESAGEDGMTDNSDRVLRFTFSERFIHVLLFGSLIILSVTGLALKYNESWPASWIIKLEGGILLGGRIHRFAAVLLIAVFAYHILSIILTERGHRFLQDMLPKKRDFADLAALVRYDLGLHPEPPLFDRFSCIEKFQYWATGVAIVMLGISGLMLWFETPFMMVFPKWTLDLNHVIHSFEATMAFLILVIWHLYNVHLDPRVFPMSRVWLDGTLSKEEIKRYHPLEYQRLYGDEKE
jgi:formate dehydrogenase subunit gamma